MIKLLFQVQRETFTVRIDNREIFYQDRKMKNEVRLIPKDPRVQKQILMSRNKINSNLMNMFELTKKEQEEYDKGLTDEELSLICIKDCESQGGVLIDTQIK